MAIGALDVLYVVLAVAVLGHGGETAGYLNAAFGAGGVLGVVATVALVGRSRLALPLAGGLVVWAAALAGDRRRLVDDRRPGAARRRRRRPDRARRRRTHAAAAARTTGRARTGLRPARERVDGRARGRLGDRAAVRRPGRRRAAPSSAWRCCCRSRCCSVFRSLLAADQAVLPIVEIARLRGAAVLRAARGARAGSARPRARAGRGAGGDGGHPRGRAGRPLLRRRGRRGRGHGATART